MEVESERACDMYSLGDGDFSGNSGGSSENQCNAVTSVSSIRVLADRHAQPKPEIFYLSNGKPEKTLWNQ